MSNTLLITFQPLFNVVHWKRVITPSLQHFCCRELGGGGGHFPRGTRLKSEIKMVTRHKQASLDFIDKSQRHLSRIVTAYCENKSEGCLPVV